MYEKSERMKWCIFCLINVFNIYKIYEYLWKHKRYFYPYKGKGILIVIYERKITEKIV